MARTGLKPEALYEKALDAAEEVIRRSGVEHARLTEVARELGISHAALYNHFSTKEALLDAVSKRWLDFIENELGKIVRQASPIRERILDWLTALHKWKVKKILADPKLFQAFHRAAEKTRPFIDAHIKVMKTQLTAMLAEGLASRELPGIDPPAAAEMIFVGTAAFHHPQLVLENRGPDQLALLKSILCALLEGLTEK